MPFWHSCTQLKQEYIMKMIIGEVNNDATNLELTDFLPEGSYIVIVGTYQEPVVIGIDSEIYQEEEDKLKLSNTTEMEIDY